MRWLILTSSTGTGHNMRADSLRQWAGRVYGNAVEVRIHAVLENTHAVYRFGVGLYNFIQRHAPILHHVYFNYLEIAAMHRHGGKILGRDNYIALIKEWRPDRIISVHAHTNHGFFDLARLALPGNPPLCITYCGELSGGYGLSRHWTNPRADGFIGATQEICAAARAVGTPGDRVLFGSFLLRPAFYASEAELEAAAAAKACKLRLDRSIFTLLLSTGIAGANNHLAILRELAATGQKLQVVVLCARNTLVRDQVEAFAAEHPSLTIRTLGHTELMPDLKRLASAIVARPGTGATSEAVLLGTPLIHNGIGGVMPQELITVQYCRLHQCGLFASSPREVARQVVRLMDEPGLADTLRANLRAARPPGHPEQIVRWIHDRP